MPVCVVNAEEELPVYELGMTEMPNLHDLWELQLGRWAALAERELRWSLTFFTCRWDASRSPTFAVPSGSGRPWKSREGSDLFLAGDTE